MNNKLLAEELKQAR